MFISALQMPERLWVFACQFGLVPTNLRTAHYTAKSLRSSLVLTFSYRLMPQYIFHNRSSLSRFDLLRLKSASSHSLDSLVRFLLFHFNRHFHSGDCIYVQFSNSPSLKT